MSPIRVLIADDQALVRGALATLLGLESDLEVVAQVGRGDEVLDAVRQHAVDVALMDIDMPGATDWRPPRRSSPPEHRAGASS